ncbi:DUF427-domain-containing protein [Mycena vitilis]|nr:DUF427-domain-containing protein [Mycena vitilis]
MKVTLNGTILADSDKTIIVDRNHYFPHDSLTKEFNDHRTDSTTSTTCYWKGVASYYNVTVDKGTDNEKTVNDIAWYYPGEYYSEDARKYGIKNYVAFYQSKVKFE